MSGKINSHNCLMLSVYKNFHQTVKYGQQRNHMSCAKISNCFSTTEIWFAKNRY